MKKILSLTMATLLISALCSTPAKAFSFPRAAGITIGSAFLGGILGVIQYKHDNRNNHLAMHLVGNNLHRIGLARYILCDAFLGGLLGGLTSAVIEILDQSKQTPKLNTSDTATQDTSVVSIADRMQASVLAAGIGDALGRPTEFIKPLQAIFDTYPNGLKSFNDFTPSNWAGFSYAPYTDDTAMAKLVLEELIVSKKGNLSLNQTMNNIAQSFINDYHKQDGWAAPYRAPGNCCIKYTKELEKAVKSNHSWWAISPANGKTGGCGSVMRAHPFGLVFYNDPEKAKIWAAEHSKLTHGDHISIASCAAMAIGTAYAMQGKDPQFVVNKMVAAALEYDKSTADKIKKAINYGMHARSLVNGKADLIEELKTNMPFRKLHEKVFNEFEGWAAHDAIAGTVYLFVLSPYDVMNAVLLGVHTPGDSDSIASMSGALVGANVGVQNIPSHFINTLEKHEVLAELATSATN